MPIPSPPAERAIFAIERPQPSLMTYYFLSSLLLGPLCPVALVPLFFRYHTMRYRFDDEGVAMRWGILFRREITLTYARIQDIHLSSNIVERWLGLARIQIQTASGSAQAEMTIEGLHDYEAVRDFLYSKMRGVRSGAPAASAGSRGGSPAHGADADRLASVLREVAGELRAVREALESEARRGS